MSRRMIVSSSIGLLVFWALIGLYQQIGTAMAYSQQSGADSASSAPPVYTEIWRNGELWFDSGAEPVAQVLSNRGWDSRDQQGVWYGLVGTSPITVEVNSARLFLRRTGSYTGTFVLDLQVFDLAGRQQRSPSQEAIDIVVQDPGEWIELPLSPEQANRIVSPNDVLAVRLRRGGEQAGDLFFNFALEVVVSSAPSASLYLPTIENQ